MHGCRNIKHAFYQPAENEMITLVHFHLLDPIMVGKKKTQDVQFYTEVMDSVQTLDGGRRSMYDPDEVEEEQRERAMRNKVCVFLVFCTPLVWSSDPDGQWLHAHVRFSSQLTSCLSPT